MRKLLQGYTYNKGVRNFLLENESLFRHKSHNLHTAFTYKILRDVLISTLHNHLMCKICRLTKSVEYQ